MGQWSFLSFYFSPKVNWINYYLLFKMATCCHRVPSPYHKCTLLVFGDGHMLDVFLLNKTLHRGLQENDTSLCLLFHGALPPRCLCKERVGHCGSMRSQPSPSSLSSACVSFPAFGGLHCAIWEAEHCAHKVAQGVSKACSSRALLFPVWTAEFGPHRGATVSYCPVQLWERAACLCSSMWLSRELAITPTGTRLQGLQNKAEAATSMGFSPVPTEHSVNFMDTHYALGIILGARELLGKYRSDMGSIPMEFTFWWESQDLKQSSENPI